VLASPPPDNAGALRYAPRRVADIENPREMPYAPYMGANAKYKDSVFSYLFSDPEALRQLYCAIKGVALPDDIPITINTLQGVLFMDRINDISFEIGGRLVVLIEHQSTINPNMALRLLMYIARVYEKIIDDTKIYATREIFVPRPEFIVLYNGTAPYPDEKILKLSDAFESVAELGLHEGRPALELTVRVLNINEGRNENIVKKCSTLAGYSAFIAKVREYEKGGESKKGAIIKAARYCREHDILTNFLKNNASGVINMLMTEWRMEDALAVRFEEGKEEGREIVAENALKQGLPLDVIRAITGLDESVIKDIQAKRADKH